VIVEGTFDDVLDVEASAAGERAERGGGNRRITAIAWAPI